MSEPKVLACSTCGAPTSFGAAFCAYCRSPLTWGAVPMLARGRLIAELDGTKDNLDPSGVLRLQKTADGAIATAEPRGAAFAPIGRQRRHGCLVVRGTALDANALIGVAARKGASGGYVCTAAPHFRSVNLAKVAASKENAFFTRLHAWEFQPGVRRTGEPNEVELRLADSIIQIFVNGHHVAACIDATYGFGGFGFHVESVTGSPARVCVRSVSLYEVA